MSINEWPILEFPALKPSILARFSTKAGEAVSGMLVKEIVENVDKPTQLSSQIRIENDQELEWIMQFVNHAFGLPFYDDDTYTTLSSAIRIYLAWMTTLTAEPHKCCPEPLRAYPDKYFRKMIDAFRNIFIPKTLSAPLEVEVELRRQGAEIRTILTAVRHLTSAVLDEYKDELWSRSLLFLMTVSDQLLSSTRSSDEIGCAVSADLSQTLFDCWTKAAILEHIPSPSYWRTLSALTWKWIPHVPIVEWWARKLLALTVVIVRDLYGPNYCAINVYDEHLMEAEKMQRNKEIIRTVWLDLFQLIGNPVYCFTHTENLLSTLSLDAANLNYFSGQVALSFFLSVFAFSKIIDIFYGISSTSIDFHECDELQAQWNDALCTLQGNKAASRSSNLSSSAIAVRENLQALSNVDSIAANNRRTHPHYDTQQQSQQQQLHINDSNRRMLENYGRNDSSNNINNGHNNYYSNKCEFVAPAHPSAGQMVWYVLRSNRFCARYQRVESGPSSGAMLDMFMDWLFDAALISSSAPRDGRPVEDHISQKSLNVHAASNVVVTGAPYSQPSLQQSHNGGNGGLQSAYAQLPQELPPPTAQPQSAASGACSTSMYSRSGTQDEVLSVAALNFDSVTRRSFATQSTASSIDAVPTTPGAPSYSSAANGAMAGSSNVTVFDYPPVDGVVAGRATALGSLCRIVCAKSTDERLSDEQLAHFYLVLYEALIERDRLILCSLIYYSVDLFKLNLRGVEILLPNYLAAIDIVLNESVKLRLHSSIPSSEMRNACLRALGAIIAWPTVFGSGKIFYGELVSDPSHKRGRLQKSLSFNALEDSFTYIDLRQRMLRILLFTLRNEIEPINLHLTLSLCHVFCMSNAHYDILKRGVEHSKTNETPRPEDSDEENAEKSTPFAVSALRGVVSAICDNLCKQQWNNDLVACLAALDCLNNLANLPHSILFHKNELSTGSLILTSLCRFVDTQLQKPPMLHSRDLHSTIVLAYFTLANWITLAPMLTEIESCLSTLANIIEFGMTGGKGMRPQDYKPASQRVCDAAEYLLNRLFILNNSSFNGKSSSALDDEAGLLQKFGAENITMENFKYFLVNEMSLIAFHEAQHIQQISRGFPTVLAVIRTPYRPAHTMYFQLRPKAIPDDKMNFEFDKENTGDDALSPGALSVASATSASNNAFPSATVDNDANFSRVEPIKQFVFPPNIHDIQCKLDEENRPLKQTPEVVAVQEKLAQIHQKLENGSTGSDMRDERNVWTQASMESLLTQSSRSVDCVKKCDSLRIFLYDMGLLSRSSYGRSLIALNSKDGKFADKLNAEIDRMSINFLETVSIFYVKSGQNKAENILQNCENLEKTSPTFLTFLNRLGRGVDVNSCFPHWTGSWRTAFKKRVGQKTPTSSKQQYVLNGENHILYHSTSQVEISFITPTLSSSNLLSERISNVSITSPKGSYFKSTENSSNSNLNELLKAAKLPNGNSIFTIKNEQLSIKIEEKEQNTQNQVNEQNEGKVTKFIKDTKQRQPYRKNSGFLASLSSFWSFTGLSGNTSNDTNNNPNVKNNVVAHENFENHSNNDNNDDNKNSTITNDNKDKDDNILSEIKKSEIETPTPSNIQEIVKEVPMNIDSNAEKAKQTMMIFRRVSSPSVAQRPSQFGLHKELQSTSRNSGYLQTSVEEISNLERKYNKQSANSFKPFQPNIECKPGNDFILNTISEETETENVVLKEKDVQTEKNIKESSIASKLHGESSLRRLSSSFEQSILTETVEDDGVVPTYTTTIIKAGTTECPSLSMAQATSIIVKSARFSAKRRDAAVTNAARTCKTHAEIRRNSLAALPSLESTKSSNFLSTSQEESDHDEPKVIVFSPLSCTVIEFPITTAQQPLVHDPNEKTSDEESNIEDVFKENGVVIQLDNDGSKKFFNNKRRNTLAKSAMDSLTGSKYSLSLLDRSNSGTKQNVKSEEKGLNSGSSLPSIFHEQISSPTFIKRPIKTLNGRQNSSVAFFVTSPSELSTTHFNFGNKLNKLEENSPNSAQTTIHDISDSQLIESKKELEQSLLMENKTHLHPHTAAFESNQNLSTSAATISFIKSFFRRKFNNLPLNEMQQTNYDDTDILKSLSTDDYLNNSKKNNIDQTTVLEEENTKLSSRDHSNLECQTSVLDCVDEHNTYVTGPSTLRNSDISLSDTIATPPIPPPWQSGELPLLGGQKSNAWLHLKTASQQGEKRTDKVVRRYGYMKVIVVWLERIEDMYNFPFDELLPCTEDNFGITASSARHSSTLNLNQQQSSFMIIYLCEIKHNSGLIHVQTEGLWARKYGQPASLVDGMVVPTTILAELIQQTVCSVARRKIVEAENYQLNHVKRRQSILEFGRQFSSNESYTDFFLKFLNCQ